MKSLSETSDGDRCGMRSENVVPGSIIQLTQEDGWRGWKGSLAVVEEITSWGVRATVRAFDDVYPIRVQFGHFKIVGTALVDIDYHDLKTKKDEDVGSSWHNI